MRGGLRGRRAPVIRIHTLRSSLSPDTVCDDSHVYMTRMRRTVALATMLAFLAISTLGAGWVLCSGVDGHREIESLTAGCCGDEAVAQHDDEQDHDPGDDDKDCGDCDDVLLAQLSPARVAGDEVPDLEAPAIAAAFIASSLADGRAAHTMWRRAPRVPPGPPPLARHLASTILRL